MTNKKRSACGTNAAYAYHIKMKEKPCEPCLEAARLYGLKRRRAKGVGEAKALAECGTKSAYNRHRRYKETPCDACKAANAAAFRKAFKKDSYRMRYQVYNRRRQYAEWKALSFEEREISHSYKMAILNDPCYYCGELKEKMEIDHKMPISRGGTDHWWNLTKACRECNSRKGAKTVEEFMNL